MNQFICLSCLFLECKTCGASCITYCQVTLSCSYVRVYWIVKLLEMLRKLRNGRVMVQYCPEVVLDQWASHVFKQVVSPVVFKEHVISFLWPVFNNRNWIFSSLISYLLQLCCPCSLFSSCSITFRKWLVKSWYFL